MVIPNCHVTRLATTPTGGNPELRIHSIETNLGPVAVPANGVVIVALGTIESTRLAKNSFDRPLMGSNLMAHLRSNYTIRIPRGALGIPASVKDLQASALFLKGRHQHADGTFGHFHLRSAELPFQAGIETQVGAATICFTDAFADGSVGG